MKILVPMACGLLYAAGLAAATLEEAHELFAAQQWAEAAAAYEEVVEREPGHALALIRLARARAASGDATRAIEALKAWFATGSGSYQVAMNLAEFKPLQQDARFNALVEPLRPCQAPEYRQFDFWLGDWDVSSPASPGGVSRNRITRVNDGCTLREDYVTPVGYAGTSLNFYDATRQVWHQTWIDNQGGALYLEGRFEGGSMVLATTTDPKAIQRITWTPLEDGRVRQHWQSTADGGQNWGTVFDGYYARRK